MRNGDIAPPDAFTSQPIPTSTQSAGLEHPSAWPYGMPTNLWPPSSKVEARSSSGGQEPTGIHMITRATVPGSPRPTIPALGNHMAAPPSGSASIPPRTRYYAAPNIDPAVFTCQIPQGQHLGVDYSEHFKKEFPAVMSQHYSCRILQMLLLISRPSLERHSLFLCSILFNPRGAPMPCSIHAWGHINR